MSKTGQVSIEFLLITAAFLGVLVVMLAALSAVFENGQTALSVLSGQRMVDDIASKTDLLLVLGDDSQVLLKLPAVSNAYLLFDGSSVQFQLPITSENKKILVRQLSLPADLFETDLSKAQQLVIQKTQGRLMINRQAN